MRGEPPADEEYAVEPNEVAVIKPSQMSLSTIGCPSMETRRLAASGSSSYIDIIEGKRMDAVSMN